MNAAVQSLPRRIWNGAVAMGRAPIFPMRRSDGMTTYIYDGMLTKQVVDYIKGMADSYPHVVEIAELPKHFLLWSRTNLLDYPSEGENCMGQKYTKVNKAWGLVHKAEGSEERFIFFKSMGERDAFVRDFKPFVLNEKPFRTEFEMRAKVA